MHCIDEYLNKLVKFLLHNAYWLKKKCNTSRQGILTRIIETQAENFFVLNYGDKVSFIVMLARTFSVHPSAQTFCQLAG